MKVLQINTVYAEGSTGKIVKEIQSVCKADGMECIAAYRCALKGMPKSEGTLEISAPFDSRLHGFLARTTMLKGCFSYFKTRSFIKKVKAYAPDLIHLHNLHGSYVNVGLLMKYIKKQNVPVVFTLHDCWAFTGICPHFTISGCDKWQRGCGSCPQRKKYSSSPIDFTGKMWRIKKKWFTGVQDLTVVTPSHWLESLVKKSFLKNYAVRVINNGIDLSVFKPVASDFRKKYSLQDKKIVLAVAFGWGYEKGLDVITELANRLPDDYRVVIVGTDDKTAALLPSQVIAVKRTNNQTELAEIYTAADVFVNPTREEVLGLVNVEALACGTPVVTFNAGGSPECIDDTCGVVVEVNDVDTTEKEILRICSTQPYSKEACRNRALLFDKDARIKEYIDLYKSFK